MSAHVFAGIAAFVWVAICAAVVRFVQVASQHDEDDEQ